MIVSVTTPGLDALLVRFAAAESRVVAGAQLVTRQAAYDVVRVAQALVPVDTGDLRSSIGFDIDPGGLGATIGPAVDHVSAAGRRVDYGPYVEYGTRPHEIDARAGGVLAGPGLDHPVEVVHHPGTRPQPFMGPAGDEVRPVYHAALHRVCAAALGTI